MALSTIASGINTDAATALANGRKLARTSTGALWCAYQRTSAAGDDYIVASYSYDNGVTWTEETVAAVVGSGQRAPAIAIDSLNNIHVVWRGQGWGTFPARYQMLYRQRIAAGWQPVELITDINSSQFWFSSIAVDSLDNIHVIWTGDGWGANPADTNIQYRVRTAAGVWQAQEGVTDVADLQTSPSMAIDRNNTVHVAWDGRLWGANPGFRNIQYRQRTVAGGWQAQEGVTDVATDTTSTSIAVDSSNNVHLVWYGTPPGGTADQVQYRRRTIVGWDAMELVTDIPAPTEQTFPSIALDETDSIYVVWAGESWGDNPTWDNIKYRIKYPTGWQPFVSITDRAEDQGYPGLLWATFPLVGGERPNILAPRIVFTGFDGAIYTVEFYTPTIATPKTKPAVATLAATGVT